jgi:hypothetical protein
MPTQGLPSKRLLGSDAPASSVTKSPVEHALAKRKRHVCHAYVPVWCVASLGVAPPPRSPFALQHASANCDFALGAALHCRGVQASLRRLGHAAACIELRSHSSGGFTTGDGCRVQRASRHSCDDHARDRSLMPADELPAPRGGHQDPSSPERGPFPLRCLQNTAGEFSTSRVN